jgi:hypothetical protein
VFEESKAREIGETWASHGIEIAAVSGTFHTIHPDPEVRADGIRRVGHLSVPLLGLGHQRDHDLHWYPRRRRHVAAASR